MNHLNEEQLIAYRYADALAEREGLDRAAVEQHLAACEACRASYQALERVLAAVEAAPLPERDAAYGSRVWQLIRGRLEQPPRKPVWMSLSLDWGEWLTPRRWVALAAMAALVVAAFYAGRHWQRPVPPTVAERSPAEVRERILLVAVGDHLDHAQMVLVELGNTQAPEAGKGRVDISSEQGRAEDLVAANRLYRQTAARAGDAAMADVLDALERTLLEIAHSPSQPTAAQLEDLRQRIESRGILFKVRVVGSEVRQREESAARTPARGSS